MEDAGSTVVEGFVDSSSTTGLISSSSRPPTIESFAIAFSDVGSDAAVAPAETVGAAGELLLPLRAGPFDGSRVVVGAAVGSVSRPSRVASIVYARSSSAFNFGDQAETRGKRSPHLSQPLSFPLLRPRRLLLLDYLSPRLHPRHSNTSSYTLSIPSR